MEVLWVFLIILFCMSVGLGIVESPIAMTGIDISYVQKYTQDHDEDPFFAGYGSR